MYLQSHPPVPLFEMMQDGVPSEKVRLYVRELKKEYEAADMTFTHPNDQRYLRYKKGGVFPAEENLVKRKSLE